MSTLKRCLRCPASLEGPPCPGTRARGICRHVEPSAPGRAAWVARLAGGPIGPAPGRPPAPGSPPPDAEAFGRRAREAVARRLDILACDYRIPLARLRDEGSDGLVDCGCGHAAVCLAGRSSRGDGAVGHECWQHCPLAGATH